MEMKVDAKTERVRIWEELLKVAKPDSKFSWQFSEFICDYEGSEKGTALLTATEMYKNAKVIFITPTTTWRLCGSRPSGIRRPWS